MLHPCGLANYGFHSALASAPVCRAQGAAARPSAYRERRGADSLDEAKAGRSGRRGGEAAPVQVNPQNRQTGARSRPMVSFEAGVETSLPLWTLYRPYVQRTRFTTIS